MIWVYSNVLVATAHELMCTNYSAIKRCPTPHVNNLLTSMSIHASGLTFVDLRSRSTIIVFSLLSGFITIMKGKFNEVDYQEQTMFEDLSIVLQLTTCVYEKDYFLNYPQVEWCWFQLFGQKNITGDPPEPLTSWRDDCSLILRKEVILFASGTLYVVRCFSRV